MKAINPATEELLCDYPEHTKAESEERLRCAEQAFALWPRTPLAERSRRMKQAANLLRERRAGYARRMTQEIGKPITAEAEIDKCGREGGNEVRR